MSYCTVDDLIKNKRDAEAELIQLTDTDNSGSIDYSVLDPAIARADAEINSYLTAYLPLAGIPANLVYIACDITRYHLYGYTVTDRIKERYEQAVSYLKLVAAGKIPLAPDTSGVAETPSADGVAFEAAQSQFSGAALNDY